MFTRKITLISGVPAEIKLITGAVQEAMTMNAKNGTDPLSILLKDCLVALGSKTALTQEDIDNLLVTDKQYLLLKLRMESYDEHLAFNLSWEKEGKKVDYTHETIIGEKDIFVKAPKTQYQEYAEVLENLQFEVELPIAQQRVNLTKITNKRQQDYLKNTNLDKLSALSFIELRKPRIVSVDAETQKPRYLSCDLRELMAKDLEVLRKAIYEQEGTVKAEIEVENPYNSLQKQRVSLLDLPSFFFYME